MATPEADLLPDKIMTALGESTHGYLVEVTEIVAPHLPQSSLARWDADLKDAITEQRAEEVAGNTDGWFYSMGIAKLSAVDWNKREAAQSGR
nr:hypothetical protein [Ruegeria sp. HKCCSP351]